MPSSVTAGHPALLAAERAAALMTEAGMPRMPARVLMALVAAPAGGWTSADLTAALGVSPAAVSGAVSYLQRLRFIRRQRRPGERRDTYTLELEPFYASVAAQTPVYRHLADDVDAIAAASEESTAQRAAEMAGFFRYLSRRMPQIIEEWRSQRGGAR